ncbi:MAG: isochorismatase family protein [Helicobacteraceae bacterium]|nr:isochorismatase family protein [Helicobacteraceae bacterium]
MLNLQESLLICIDAQEKLINAMAEKERFLKNARILLKGVEILSKNVDEARRNPARQSQIIFSEQYKKGLENTHNALEIPHATHFEKTTFSIFKDEEITNHIKRTRAKELIICGIEAHICVLQSVFDALNLGYSVWVAEDAVTSRDLKNYKNAIELMRQFGAKITCAESALFALMQDCKHKNFKEISALIK